MLRAVAALADLVTTDLYGDYEVEARKRLGNRECAEHVRQLEGESPFHNLMEVK